jgi:NAD(P)-dependent dehydrogenase (short-subunit alcohol dehydrogenase family)
VSDSAKIRSKVVVITGGARGIGLATYNAVAPSHIAGATLGFGRPMASTRQHKTCL